MADCCPPTAWPALAPPEGYTPMGTEVTLDDLQVYTVGEPGPKAVLVFPEVFGWGGRLKGICDTLAGEGYFVVRTVPADQIPHSNIIKSHGTPWKYMLGLLRVSLLLIPLPKGRTAECPPKEAS